MHASQHGDTPVPPNRANVTKRRSEPHATSSTTGACPNSMECMGHNGVEFLHLRQTSTAAHNQARAINPRACGNPQSDTYIARHEQD